VWLTLPESSRTEVTSWLFGEPWNPGWKMALWHPGPDDIFEPFLWEVVSRAAFSDHTMLLYVFRGSVWYRFYSSWLSIGSDTILGSWEA
jgi:hypothetical protein